ncbi:MAG: hypothetical protein K0S39_3405 [Paenibacillus sp.]|jgi:hypothetical protein|nr:hypothetical protein [Paenibacillus sp.]
MAELTLEFRGIRLEHLISYLKELQGIQQNFEFPYMFHGPSWQANILSEAQMLVTSRFRVNAVFIRFEAPDDEELHDVITAFRRKTFRAGG